MKSRCLILFVLRLGVNAQTPILVEALRGFFELDTFGKCKSLKDALTGSVILAGLIKIGSCHQRLRLRLEDRWRLAVHEAGHAVAFYAVEAGLKQKEFKLLMASISPDTASGVTTARALRQPSMWKRDTLTHSIVVALAGRAAEETFLPDTSPCMGSLSDMTIAKSIAELSVTSLAYGPRGIQGLIPSKSTRKETQDILHSADQNATQCLQHNLQLLDRVARILFLKEYISAGQVRKAAKSIHLQHTSIQGDRLGIFFFENKLLSPPRIQAPRKMVAFELFDLFSQLFVLFFLIKFLREWFDDLPIAFMRAAELNSLRLQLKQGSRA